MNKIIENKLYDTVYKQCQMNLQLTSREPPFAAKRLTATTGMLSESEIGTEAEDDAGDDEEGPLGGGWGENVSPSKRASLAEGFPLPLVSGAGRMKTGSLSFSS